MKKGLFFVFFFFGGGGGLDTHGAKGGLAGFFSGFLYP